jgi:hypothetical protein
MDDYDKESKALLDEYSEKYLKIIEKYKGQVYNGLDGSPESREIDKNRKQFKEELKKLKEKYNRK